MIPIGLNVDVNWKTLAAAAIIVTVAIMAATGKMKEVAAAVNPVSADNVFNKAAESVGQAVTGQKDWTPGGAVYDWGHNNETNEPNFFGKIMDTITGV